MVEMIQGGSTANRTGNVLEKQIVPVLLGAGYVQHKNSDVLGKLVKGDPMIDFGEKWFTTQISLERNIYEAKFRSDFFLFHHEKFKDGLHVECKWQGSQGSVDEKYVFTVLSLCQLNTDSLLLLDGGGARRGAINWINAQTKKNKRFVFCASIGQFNNWALKNL